MNQLQVIYFITLCWTCCWAYNRYEPSYVHFELDSDEMNDNDDDDDDNKGMPYGFEYDVNDGHENNFGHWQQSDGSVTTGSYRVQLPDGRTQIVTYRADENGYNAQVTYEPTAIKPLSYRTTTTTPPPRPLYEFPGIPPYHGPTNAHGAYQQQSTSSSSNSYGSIGMNSFNYYETAADATRTTSGTAAPPYSSDDGSDESIITENPIPLLFRSNLYGDISRIPLGYRSTSLNSKRSPSSSIWSPEQQQQQQQPQGAVNISKALDTRGDEEQFHDENDKQIESPSDDSSASTHLNNAVVDFDHLPFPLPVPLAFRSV